MSTIIYSTTLGGVLSNPTVQNPATVASGATVTNSTAQNNGDAIYGSNAAAWTVTNYGTVEGNQSNPLSGGIFLSAGGYIENRAAGLISGVANGIYITAAAGTVGNSGTIAATGTDGHGIHLKSGGVATNQQGGLISGQRDGVYLTGTTGTISNSGTIEGVGTAYNDGIFLNSTAASVISNAGSAVISGYVGIILNGAASTISNSGTVLGTAGVAVYLGAGAVGGSLSNAPGGLISGVGGGVYLYGGAGAISNAGTIEVSGYGQGVLLQATTASLTNGQTGVISGHAGVNLSGTASTVGNFGTIQGVGTFSVGILLQGQAGARVSNAPGGLISGDAGIEIVGIGAGSVSNFGTIRGDGGDTAPESGTGIYLETSGAVVNGASNVATAMITGATSGIKIIGGTGSIINYGQIVATAANGVGVNLSDAAAATVTNRGMVVAGTNGTGVFLDSGNVTNFGTILAPGLLGTAVYVRYGTFFNYGMVEGAVSGIELALGTGAAGTGNVTVSGTVIGGVGISVAPLSTAGQTLTVAGMVIGTSGTAVALQGGNNRLILAPGAASQGKLDGGGGQSVVEVAASTGMGAAAKNDGVATVYVSLGSVSNFSALQVDPGAATDADGSLTFDTLVNQGQINLAAGDALVVGTVAAAAAGGTMDLKSGGSVHFTGAVAGSQTVLFRPPGGTVAIDHPEEFAAAITQFAATDLIDLPLGTASFQQYSGGVLSLAYNGQTVALQLTTTAVAPQFQFTPDGAGGTDILVSDAVCFCRGTLILTERGEVAVEDLKVGDRVRTLAGELKPILWIGMGGETVSRGNKLSRPIIVRRGALAEDVPARDLYLTHGHALYLDGALIPVENLVNHHSIVWDEGADSVEYYHIELADHDVLLANGAPAESYYDARNRALFHNTRPGSVPANAVPQFAPVLSGGAAVELVWRALLERAGGRVEAGETDDPDLHLVVNGARLDPAGVDGLAYSFELPAAPAGALCLGSRGAVPSLLGVTAHDHRRLGVAIGRIVISQRGIATTLEHDAPVFAQGGCHPPEDGYSWTDGACELPARLFAHFRGPFTLTVHTLRPGGLRYNPAGEAQQAA